MKELWVKKTVYRRYLIEDSDVEEAKIFLESFDAYKEDSIEIIELIENTLDRNKETEYDEEKTFLPLTYLLTTPLDFIKEPITGKEIANRVFIEEEYEIELKIQSKFFVAYGLIWLWYIESNCNDDGSPHIEGFADHTIEKVESRSTGDYVVVTEEIKQHIRKELNNKYN